MSIGELLVPLNLLGSYAFGEMDLVRKLILEKLTELDMTMKEVSLRMAPLPRHGRKSLPPIGPFWSRFSFPPIYF